MTHRAALPRNIRRPRFWWLQGCFKVASRSPPRLLQCWIMLAKRIVGLCGVRARGSNSLAFADHIGSQACLILLPCGHRLESGGGSKLEAHQTRRNQSWASLLLRRRIAKTAPREILLGNRVGSNGGLGRSQLLPVTRGRGRPMVTRATKKGNGLFSMRSICHLGGMQARSRTENI